MCRADRHCARALRSMDRSDRIRREAPPCWRPTPDPNVRIAGVDYDRLAEHLRREDLVVRDFLYVRDLTAIHAFLET